MFKVDLAVSAVYLLASTPGLLTINDQPPVKWQIDRSVANYDYSRSGYNSNCLGCDWNGLLSLT
jgi:hypothetical protein